MSPSSPLDLLTTATDVTLLAHVRPDADALGSALALGRALQQRGAVVRVSFALPDEVPESLRGLDAGNLVVAANEVPPSSPLLVCCDTPAPARLGSLADRVEATKAAGGSVLVVDHHASNTRYGTHHVVDDTAEATAVLVLDLLDQLGAPLDEPIARCLYAGLVTDTSGFRRATASTHRAAARLVEAGVDPDRLSREVVDDHPFAWLPMLSKALGTACLEPEAAQGYGLVHAFVTLDAAADVRLEEVEGVVDVVRGIRDAEVAAVFKQQGPREWTVSLRAVGKIDVSVAARTLGGGGHRLAAGATLHGTPDEVLTAVRDALAEAPLL
ncbi:nanoRNase/pAp phosphatase (c-di-AMP/oligoRNAs hydrolase) [Amycolatopsis bartoniae]|uniref:Phosphoesterase n=1 Tax=Amycolatopsis bartoniae TaxID=941986 RepID=A0A8H9IZU3_9PSEU|nr:DHH family phosphoesterase [Amycolatopsis bartoniae]MBB2935503.1 nanoRNase/pAp phosphatase (c-di-AMP/oligoRNAs hydrolase) [Amycolatopsis bartoniae]TVT03901.1 bifunctional oligoribonuclease/PAP phosphatase NrnA [Amycolatopsis bartoniae]GHF76410.1 phosphoesterase [Amycolatopsis bartoniae]